MLAVVWFHSGLAGLSGGFAGVDVFFVISGYLIAGIIGRELAAGQFSFKRFYQRRVRRIALALIVVLLASLVAGYALLLPFELVKLGESALAALGMAPNLYFWGETDGGYFGLTKRITPPLLHTWSLGVEEQFYLLFPLFLVLAARWKLVRPALWVGAALSFALCVVGSTLVTKAAFYLLPTRAWELALGALLASGAIALPERMRADAGIAGLAMIIGGMALLKAGGQSPLWLVVVPVLGTVLAIGAGAAGPVGRLLALPPLVSVGQISYSLYLWHWPVFAFLKHWRIETELAATWAVVGIALSLGLAALSYRWIEQPARLGMVPFRRVLALVLPGAALVAAFGAAAIAQLGWPQRFDREALARLAQSSDKVPLAESCDTVPLAALSKGCQMGHGSPQALIWGDSHAGADSAGIAEGLGQPTLLATWGGCPPGLAPPGAGLDLCVQRNRAVIDWLKARPEIATVVLVANWPRRKAEGEAPWRDVQAAIDALPGRRVIVIAGTPLAGIDVPWASALRQSRGMPPLQLHCPPARVQVHGALVVDFSAAFCAHPKPWLLLTDGNHPSATANREVIAPTVRAAIAARRE